LGFAIVTCLVLSGCGPGQGDLAGAVTFQGKQLASGSVIVRGSDGVVVGGEIMPDGTYLVKDITAGKVLITVNSPDPGDYKVAMRKKDQAPPPPKDRSKWFPIPEHFGDFEKSELSFLLKRGKNQFDIELKSK